MSTPEDPSRWASGAADAPPGFDVLLRADGVHGPSADALRRVLAGVAAEVGRPELAQQGQAAGPAVRGGGSSLFGKIAAGACVLGLLAGASVWLGRGSPKPEAPPPAPAPALHGVQSTPAAPPPAAEAAAAPVAPETAGPSATKPPAHPRAASGPERDQLAAADPVAEIALLERAQRALRDDPKTALGLAEQHKRRFEHGSLTQEREMLAIEALLALGRRPAAERRARAFVRAFPHSSHLPRLHDLLRSDP